MDLSYYLDLDESSTSCECSSEEERTPETILERVYRSIERRYYSSDSSSSCCGGAPRIDQDDYSLPSDGTEADDDDGGGGGTKPRPDTPPVVGPMPDSDFVDGDGDDFPYLTAPKNNVTFRTVNATFTSDRPYMYAVANGLPGAVTNEVNTCNISVVEKVSRIPATPAQHDFFDYHLFNDQAIGDFASCPIEGDALLEVTITFCNPMEFNALFILAPYNPRYVWGSDAIDAWLLTQPVNGPFDFTILGTPDPVPPSMSFRIENWYLLNNDYSTTIPFFDYGRDSLFTTPTQPYPGLSGGFPVLPLEATNKPFANVFQLGRINSVDFADPVGDVTLTPSDMPLLSYGLTHKFRFDVYPSNLQNQSVWIFGQQVIPGEDPLIRVPVPP